MSNALLCYVFERDLTNKRKLEEQGTVALTEECSVTIQNKLLAKFKDPCGFSIPCLIGNVCIDWALCDLGLCASLMPLTMYEKLDLGEMRPTKVGLRRDETYYYLEDHFVKYLVHILEDVLIKVEDLYVLVDFVILEIEKEMRTPIILGMPF